MLAMISQPMGGIPEDAIYRTRLRISQKLAQLNIDVKDTLSFQSAVALAYGLPIFIE